MNSSELISIIVPVYNCETYLRPCIDSIIQQTYINIEIILIDDGSTDASGRICDEYARFDKRIGVIHTKNSGPAAARNMGIERSRGRFLFFLDADDFIKQTALQLLIDAYDQTKADIILSDFKSFSNGTPGPGHKGIRSENRLFLKHDIIDCARSYLKRPNKFTLFAYSWGRLFSASIIRDHHIAFDTDLHTYEDVAFNYDYLRYTEKVYFLSASLYNHIFHDHYMSATMMMSGNPRKLFGYIQALDHIGGFLKDRISDTNIRREVGHAYVSLTIIQFIRTCGQINNDNRKKIGALVGEIIHDERLRNNLRFYAPSKGDSRVIPFLMKLQLVQPILWVCKYKAHKRYGKGAAVK